MSKERFKELIEKYRQGRISRSEYWQLIHQLNEQGIEGELDKLLDQSWKILEPLSLPEYEETDFEPKATEFPSRLGQIHHIEDSRVQQINTSPTPRYIWWALATSLILAIGFFIYLSGSSGILKNPGVVYQTGYGERQEITLNDGSLITLNANSKIRWNENWESTGSRQIILEGEAFFEVEKKNGIPFIVETEDVSVVVLGTAFNVDSREEKTEVYLEEGKVNLKLRNEPDLKNVKTAQEIVMKPGDQVRYSVREKKVERFEGQTMITAAAWKNNVLNFKNMQFSEVLNLLREIYGQSFECSDSKLLSTPMYLGVPYSDWEAVRQALELSLNIEFQRVENRRYKVLRIKN